MVDRLRRVIGAVTLGIGALVATLAAATAPAWAEHGCSAPLADWQPPKALQDKLAAEGWTITRLRIDDGCYEVRAVNGQGETREDEFDPASLEVVRRHHHSRGEDGSRHGDDRPGD